MFFGKFIRFRAHPNELFDVCAKLFDWPISYLKYITDKIDINNIVLDENG